MVIERETAPVVALWRGPEADLFERAEALGFGLRRYPDQNCYWLTAGHLSQCCPTAADVERALEFDSAWRQACARAGIVPVRVAIVEVQPVVVGVQAVKAAPAIAAPVAAAPVTPHVRKPLRWQRCEHCDFVTKQGKRLADHIAAEHRPGAPVQPVEPTLAERRAMVVAAANRAGVAIKPVPAPRVPVKAKAAPVTRIRYCTNCYLRVSVAAKDKCDNCGAPLKGN